MKDLQQYLNEKYQELRLDVKRMAGITSVSGIVGFDFAMYLSRESASAADEHLLGSLEDAKELVESSIEKVKISLGKPEKILGVDVIRVDDEYWAGIDAIDVLMTTFDKGGVEPGMQIENTGAMYYNNIPIIYKPAFDK